MTAWAGSMNAMDFFEQVAALRREGQSFALATVVARRAPVSAHLGDRAIVFADGRMEGFVGGACSREIVRQQALDALRTRRSRLVSIRPDASEHVESTAEHVVVPMTCVVGRRHRRLRRAVRAGATTRRRGRHAGCRVRWRGWRAAWTTTSCASSMLASSATSNRRLRRSV